jgi:transposase-like protein
MGTRNKERRVYPADFKAEAAALAGKREKPIRQAAAGLKKIYLSPSAELASAALEEFAGVWDTKYPMTAKSWRNRWNEVIPIFKFSPEIRKAVYTANAIESVNYTVQKIIKHRQSFPNDERR